MYECPRVVVYVKGVHAGAALSCDVSRRPQHEHQTKIAVAIGLGVSVDTGAYYCYSSLRWRSHSAFAAGR